MVLLNIFTWAFESAFNIAHIVGLILALVLYYYHLPENLTKPELYNKKVVVFLLLCACELYGFSHRTGDPTWFMSSVKNFFLGLLYIAILFWVLYVQFHSMIDLLQESQYKGHFKCEYVVGYLGMVAAVATWIILSFVKTDEIVYAGYVLIISQIIQLAIVLLAAVRQKGSIPYALLSFLIYAAGVVSLVYSLIQLVMMAIIALLIFGVLKGGATGAAKGAFSSEKESTDYDSIVGPGGGELYGDRIDKDHFISSGEHYKRTYDGFAEVWEKED